MGLTRGSLSGGARPALPALLREGKRSTGLYPAPCSGTRASARQAMHQGPWQPPGHHPVLKTPSSLASGTASAADSCKKCWVQVQVPWEGGGKVQPGSATKYGKNSLGRQEPHCRVKCFYPGPGSGCWLRGRSGPGQQGPCGRWPRESSSPRAGTGRVTSLPACLQSLLSASRRQEKPTVWGQGHRPSSGGGEKPWQGGQHDEPKRQSLANGEGAEARGGHVLWVTVSGMLGLGKVRLWDIKQLMSEIQLSVI